MGQSVLESSVAVETSNISPLVLGHCNGPRAGEVIQLTRPKCYLGAGNLSTNGPSKPNMAGVHCLILRGPQRTIVRRWSQLARLNGRPFSDAALTTGDRLQLGAIELEVLADNTEETLAQWWLRLGERDGSRREARESEFQSREAELARRAAGLERNEHDIQQKTEQSLRLAEELHRRQVLLDVLAAEVCARDNEAGRRAAANDQLRIELDAQAASLEQASRQFHEKVAAAASEQAQLADNLRARIAAWEVQQAAEAAILGARETAITQAESRLAERNAHLADMPPADAVRAELDQQRESIARDRIQLEQARAEIENARQEIDAQRASLLQDRHRHQEHETALVDREKLLEQSATERDRQFEELASQRLRIEAETRLLEEQRAAVDATRQAVAQAQAELLAAKEEGHRVANADLERRRHELTEQQQQLAERERQFDERLAVYSAERTEFAAGRELSDERLHQLQRQEQELATRECELVRQRDELAQQRETLERLLAENEQRRAHVAKQEHQLADRAAELDALAAQQAELLDSQRQELHRSQVNFAAECTVRQRAWDETRSQCEIAQRQYKDATQGLEQQRAEINSRQAAIDEQLAELAARSAELSAREQSLAEQQQSLTELEQSIAAREAAVDSLSAATSPATETLAVDSAATETTEDVFRRLGVLSLLRESSDEIAADPSDESISPESSPESLATESTDPELSAVESEAPATADRKPDAPSQTPDPVDLDEGDEAQVIERYMSQLLSRVRGGKSETAPAIVPAKPAKTSSPKVHEPSPSEVLVAPVVVAATAIPVVVHPEPAALATPRIQYPSTSDLSAMRALANQSAQAAINTHTRTLLLNDLYVKTIICLTGIVSGIVLLSWAPRIGWVGLIAGGACFGGSIAWGVKIGMLFREFLKASGVNAPDDSETSTHPVVPTPAHPEQVEPSNTAN